MARPARQYDTVIGRLTTGEGSRLDRMQAVVDGLWSVLAGTGVSWVGFYLDQPAEPDDRRLVLGPHRDAPACSPIGLNGVCGSALGDGRDVIIEDVSVLGDAYIACDPRDRSEIVIPLQDGQGTVWAVLDLDSRDVSAFDETDAAGLHRVLAAAGLS